MLGLVQLIKRYPWHLSTAAPALELRAREVVSDQVHVWVLQEERRISHPTRSPASSPPISDPFLTSSHLSALSDPISHPISNPTSHFPSHPTSHHICPLSPNQLHPTSYTISHPYISISHPNQHPVPTDYIPSHSIPYTAPTPTKYDMPTIIPSRPIPIKHPTLHLPYP